MTRSGLLVLLPCLACGGGGSDGFQLGDCLFQGQLTGGVEATLEYDSAAGCGGSGFEDRLALSLGVNERYIVYLDMTGVPERTTNPSAPASFEVVDTMADPQLSWLSADAACTLNITENGDDADMFGLAVVGSGTCAGPAVARDGNTMPDVMLVGTFQFGAGAAWSGQ
jgi:hypothetical protein